MKEVNDKHYLKKVRKHKKIILIIDLGSSSKNMKNLN